MVEAGVEKCHRLGEVEILPYLRMAEAWNRNLCQKEEVGMCCFRKKAVEMFLLFRLKVAEMYYPEEVGMCRLLCLKEVETYLRSEEAENFLHYHPEEVGMYHFRKKAVGTRLMVAGIVRFGEV